MHRSRLLVLGLFLSVAPAAPGLATIVYDNSTSIVCGWRRTSTSSETR